MTIADALGMLRPGGGESYSGGGGHGGGDSGGGGGGGAALVELIFHLVRLCIYYPKIGIPLVCLLIGIWIYSAWKKHQTKDWDSGPPVELQTAVSLDRVRELDPDFSQILFEDFVYRLYATCLESRHDDNALAGLAPWVSPTARDQLVARQPRANTTGVTIGAMRVFSLSLLGPQQELFIELETNYTAAGSTTYAIEHWTITRAQAARTKKRDLSKGFPCPNCGAPWQADATDTARCSFCSEIVNDGRFEWQVAKIEVVHTKQQPPTLTKEVKERGTDLDTYRDSSVHARWSQLCADDPALNQDALMSRLRLIFTELYAAWDVNDLPRARMYLSDGLYDYMRYWIDAYKAQGLRNRVADMRITRTDLARVTRDRWYDAIVIRIWGTGTDYVVKVDGGSVVRGSTLKERAYSEYWTLIRSAERRGPTNPNPSCSNCGAPAQVGASGACEHCNAHVTGGEFDWVLSKIEQDDSYRG